MAAALGCHAELVEQPDAIRPALERAAASGLPAVINVITDPSVESQTSAFTEYATR
jgi:acetolactate synthase-1/2/3 large subunit